MQALPAIGASIFPATVSTSSRLWQSEFSHLARAMLDDLAAVSCSSAGGRWRPFDRRTDLTDELFALLGRESPTKWMRTKDVKPPLNNSIEPAVEIPR